MAATFTVSPTFPSNTGSGASGSLIEADLTKGRKAGKDMFDPSGRTGGISEDILSRRVAALNQGVPDSARAAVQDQVGAQTNTALRKLQGSQAFKGLKGGAAAKQQGDVVAQGAAEGIAAQRKIEQEDAALKRDALERLSTEVNRRQFGILAREFGQAELGVAQRTGNDAIRSAESKSTSGGGLFSAIFG